MEVIDKVKYEFDMRLTQLFENKADCYADTKNEELIPAMTREKFIEVCRQLVGQNELQVSNDEPKWEDYLSFNEQATKEHVIGFVSQSFKCVPLSHIKDWKTKASSR